MGLIQVILLFLIKNSPKLLIDVVNRIFIKLNGYESVYYPDWIENKSNYGLNETRQFLMVMLMLITFGYFNM